MERRTISRREFGAAALAVGAGVSREWRADAAQAAPARGLPRFQVDALWPKIPNNWAFGPVTSIRVDEQDHVWILQRPRSVQGDQKGREAPPVLEFDADGNFLNGWGGPGERLRLARQRARVRSGSERLRLDLGNNPNFGRTQPNQNYDDMLLKFTMSGRFVLQVGGRNRSGGVKDTTSVHEPAECAFSRKTNEIVVADGYGNRRVIVFDGNSGAFKRMWGAFGRPPVDQPRACRTASPGSSTAAKGPSTSGSCTPCASRTTASSTSAIATTAASRCSRWTASTSGRCSSTWRPGRRAPPAGSRSRRTRRSGSCTCATSSTA